MPTFWQRVRCVLTGGHVLTQWHFQPRPSCFFCGWEAKS
jgi:hypothetical protein